MKVAIVGSRDYPRWSSVYVYVYVMGLPEDAIVVSGGAVGVDTLAAKLARARGLTVVEYLPDYDRHGRAAPLYRNTTIAESCDRLTAYWTQRSTGTVDALKKALERGKPVEVFDVWGRRVDPAAAIAWREQRRRRA